MADLSSVSTVELLTRAADAAEDYGLEIHSNMRSWSLEEVQAHTVGLRASQRLRIVASGPDHWRAVEATFRRALERHVLISWRFGEVPTGVECECGQVPEPSETCCRSLEDLRPLAVQVLQNLGDTP